ncbi:MAG: response regulator transcription factor [Proteobacteria bacterium]|nr:response regulator transcription factor [Pseudomonadota bacterium]
MVYSVLVVDDDNRIRDLLAAYLEKNNFIVTKAANSLQARGYLKAQSFDLLILDIMMPGEEDGLALAQNLRKTSQVPIILLTAKDDLSDKVLGLNSGADDYIIKPFEPEELLARINSLLRRINLPIENDSLTSFKFGSITFDILSMRLFEEKGEEIFLSSTELLLLKVLCQNLGKALTREELATRGGFVVSERTIDVQITRLRKKIKDDVLKPKYIKTVRHVGYALYCE